MGPRGQPLFKKNPRSCTQTSTTPSLGEEKKQEFYRICMTGHEIWNNKMLR